MILSSFSRENCSLQVREDSRKILRPASKRPMHGHRSRSTQLRRLLAMSPAFVSGSSKADALAGAGRSVWTPPRGRADRTAQACCSRSQGARSCRTCRKRRAHGRRAERRFRGRWRIVRRQCHTAAIGTAVDRLCRPRGYRSGRSAGASA